MSGPQRDREAEIRSWLRTEGFWLEHQTSATLNANGWHGQLGHVYRDTQSGKLRDIDVLADPMLTFPRIRLKVAIECKAGQQGAWVVRQAELSPVTFQPTTISTDRASQFLSEHADVLRRAFPLQVPNGFAVLVVGEKPDGFSSLQQAVSSAYGALTFSVGSAIVHPVVVTAAPLYGLTYDENGRERLPALPWARVFFSGGRQPVLVDVVQNDSFRDYLVGLRQSFEDLWANMEMRGWQADQ